METQAHTVESFNVDHTKMDAPQVRMAGRLTGPKGDVITKFDLRFVKPNTVPMPTEVLHTLEHLLAKYLRNVMDGVVDLSPMGCRTGFYLIVFGEHQAEEARTALIFSLRKVLQTRWEDVPGTDERSCGNYRDHSLPAAIEFAAEVLKGLER